MPATSWAAILRFFNWTTPGDSTAAVGRYTMHRRTPPASAQSITKQRAWAGQSTSAPDAVFRRSSRYH